MSEMQSFLSDLIGETPEGRREMVRARLRVDVSESLLLRMEALNMSKAELAATLGVSRSAVSQALTGTRNMSINTLADMANALGMQAHLVLEAQRSAKEASAARPAAAALTIERAPGIATAGNATQRTFTLQLAARPQPAHAFQVIGTSATSAVTPLRVARCQ